MVIWQGDLHEGDIVFWLWDEGDVFNLALGNIGKDATMIRIKVGADLFIFFDEDEFLPSEDDEEVGFIPFEDGFTEKVEAL